MDPIGVITHGCRGTGKRRAASIVPREALPARDSDVLDVMVEGPEAAGLTDADLRRFFPAGTLSSGRLDRLRHWPRIVVRLNQRPLGVATFTQVDGETRIPDFALDVSSRTRTRGPGLERRVLYALLDAIDRASTAGACRRIALIPPRIAAAILERQGYVGVREGCAGAWMEKSLARIQAPRAEESPMRREIPPSRPII